MTHEKSTLLLFWEPDLETVLVHILLFRDQYKPQAFYYMLLYSGIACYNCRFNPRYARADVYSLNTCIK